jgi:multidrug efflux pump subunit AcrA (membrane-fusion protein)
MTLKSMLILNNQPSLFWLKKVTIAVQLTVISIGLTACNDHSSAQNKAAPKAEYTAIARGKVEISGGLLDINAPENSVYSRINVKLGDQIQQGQILAQLDPHSAELDVDQAKAALAQAYAQLHMQNIRLPAAQRFANRWKKAATLGVAQQQQADDAAQAVAQIEAESAVAAAEVQIQQQKVNAAEYALDKQKIRAPQAGEIIKVWVQQGSTSTLDQHIAFTVLPQRPLVVRAEVNESFISHIKMGMKASLTLEDTSSDTRLTAHVIQISKIYETASLGNDPTLQNSRVVSCILALDTSPTSQQDKQNQQQNTNPPLLIGQNLLVKFYD